MTQSSSDNPFESSPGWMRPRQRAVLVDRGSLGLLLNNTNQVLRGITFSGP